MITDEMDAWAQHLRFRYGLSAPVDPVMAAETEIVEDGALYGELPDDDDLTD